MKRTQTAGLLLASMLASSALLDVSANFSVVTETGVNPGLAIRLEQATFDAFKTAMQDFLPSYIQHDAKLPTTYSY